MDITKDELISIKSELLCTGLSIDKTAADDILEINKFILDKDFAHAAHIKLNEDLINTFISEKFCNRSNFSIIKKNNSFKLHNTKTNKIYPIKIIKSPSWCFETVDDIMIGNIIRPHNDSIISSWPVSSCIYFKNDKKCKFCTLTNNSKNPELKKTPDVIEPEIFLKMILKALEHKNNYEINLGGGIYKSPDYSYDYMSEICELIRKYTNNSISVEMYPPTNMQKLKELKKSGANSIIINLEIYDDEIRKEICPGKIGTPKSYYYKTFTEAVKVFGKGNVSSVLIAGIQPDSDILKAAGEMIELNVIPTIIPFKPFDNCQLSYKSTTNYKNLIDINKKVEEMKKQRNLKISKSNVCSHCGGCSLEKTCENK